MDYYQKYIKYKKKYTDAKKMFTNQRGGMFEQLPHPLEIILDKSKIPTDQCGLIKDLKINTDNEGTVNLGVAISKEKKLFFKYARENSLYKEFRCGYLFSLLKQVYPYFLNVYGLIKCEVEGTRRGKIMADIIISELGTETITQYIHRHTYQYINKKFPYLQLVNDIDNIFDTIFKKYNIIEDHKNNVYKFYDADTNKCLILNYNLPLTPSSIYFLNERIDNTVQKFNNMVSNYLTKFNIKTNNNNFEWHSNNKIFNLGQTYPFSCTIDCKQDNERVEHMIRETNKFIEELLKYLNIRYDDNKYYYENNSKNENIPKFFELSMSFPLTLRRINNYDPDQNIISKLDNINKELKQTILKQIEPFLQQAIEFQTKFRENLIKNLTTFTEQITFLNILSLIYFNDVMEDLKIDNFMVRTEKLHKPNPKINDCFSIDLGNETFYISNQVIWDDYSEHVYIYPVDFGVCANTIIIPKEITSLPLDKFLQKNSKLTFNLNKTISINILNYLVDIMISFIYGNELEIDHLSNPPITVQQSCFSYTDTHYFCLNLSNKSKRAEWINSFNPFTIITSTFVSNNLVTTILKNLNLNLTLDQMQNLTIIHIYKLIDELPNAIRPILQNFRPDEDSVVTSFKIKDISIE